MTLSTGRSALNALHPIGISTTLPLSRIRKGDNPRRYFDRRKHDELVVSVRRRGVLQPILLRPTNDPDESYAIVAGERRYRAALEVFGTEGRVPVVIREMTDQEAFLAVLYCLSRRAVRVAFGQQSRPYRALTSGDQVMDQDTPIRRPAIRSVSRGDVGEALGRLVPIALPPTRAAQTGASSKVADFPLAWWNGDDNGHFPIFHLCNLDETIAEDMLIIMAYLSQNTTVFAGDWAYADDMAELWTRYREVG